MLLAIHVGAECWLALLCPRASSRKLCGSQFLHRQNGDIITGKGAVKIENVFRKRGICQAHRVPLSKWGSLSLICVLTVHIPTHRLGLSVPPLFPLSQMRERACKPRRRVLTSPLALMTSLRCLFSRLTSDHLFFLKCSLTPLLLCDLSASLQTLGPDIFVSESPSLAVFVIKILQNVPALLRRFLFNWLPSMQPSRKFLVRT